MTSGPNYAAVVFNTNGLKGKKYWRAKTNASRTQPCIFVLMSD